MVIQKGLKTERKRDTVKHKDRQRNKKDLITYQKDKH